MLSKPEGCTWFRKWVALHRNQWVAQYLFKIMLSLNRLRSRGSTKRSATRPLGREDAPSVRAGNTMVARCVLIILLAASRGINWCLEQPQGSLMERHPAMQSLFSLVRVWRKRVKMADFNAATNKATWLYSGLVWLNCFWCYKSYFGCLRFTSMSSFSVGNPHHDQLWSLDLICSSNLILGDPKLISGKRNCCQEKTPVTTGHSHIEEIDQFRPRRRQQAELDAPMVKHYVDRNGLPRVQGAGGLKQSQAYTPALLVYCLVL